MQRYCGSDDSVLVSTDQRCQDNKVRLHKWDGKKLEETGLLEGHQAQISALAFSPDGKCIATGDVSISRVLRCTQLI